MKNIVARYAGKLTWCFEQALSDTPDLAGKVLISWTILPSGRVKDVQVMTDETGHEGFVACLERGVGKFLFPPGLGGEVQYPFYFRP
jgi:hypothetical protein